MAIGTTLANLLVKLKDETGRRDSSGGNEDPKLSQKLRRAQELYYDDWDWPHLEVLRTITLVQNQRFYTFPSDMNPDATEGLYVKDSGDYKPLVRGIGIEQYSGYDSLQAVAASGTVTVTAGTLSAGVNKVSAVTIDGVDCLGAAVDHTGDHATTAAAIAAQINSYTSSPNYRATSSGAVVTIYAFLVEGSSANDRAIAVTDAGDVTTSATSTISGGVNAEQSVPAAHWDIREDDETAAVAIEVWPVPSVADTLVLVGKRAAGALSASSDTAVIDDTLLVLTVASELMARENKKDADALASAAQRRYLQLKKNSKKGDANINMAGQRQVHRGTVIRVS